MSASREDAADNPRLESRLVMVHDGEGSGASWRLNKSYLDRLGQDMPHQASGLLDGPSITVAYSRDL